MKKALINIVINYPYKLMGVILSSTIVLVSGIWIGFVVEDDFLKIFPKDMESWKTWEGVQEDFGYTEYIFIAFGNKGEDIYSLDAFNKIKILTEKLESDDRYINEVVSVRTLFRIDDGNIENLVPDELTNNKLDSIRDYLDDNPKLKSRVISDSDDYTCLIIRPNTHYNNEQINAVDLVASIKNIVGKELAGYETHYAGQPYIVGIVPNLIVDDASTLMIVGLLIMLILLIVNIRDIRSVALILITIILSVLSMNGFMGWLYYLTESNIFNFTLLHTSMPIILLTIANSDGVHIVTRFFREVRRTKNIRKAIESTLDRLSLPIFLTSLTTAIAFLTMLSSPIPHMAGYGITIAFGVVWAWILSVTFIPSALRTISWDLSAKSFIKASFLERCIESMSKQIINRPKKVLFIGIAILCFGLTGLRMIIVEVNIINFFKSDSPIAISTEFVDENLTGSMSLVIRLDADYTDPKTLNYIDSLQTFIESIPSVKLSLSLADLIKQKNKSDFGTNTVPESSDVIAAYASEFEISGGDDINSLVDTYDFRTGVINAMIKSVSTSEVINITDKIERYIHANPPPSKNSIQITGLLKFLNDFVNLVIESSIMSILLSVLIIWLISFIFFKRMSFAFISIIPLSFAIILNFGLMGLFGIELSHMTALLTSVIIGVGVDFAIHYINDAKKNIESGTDIDSLTRKTSNDVGYPIILDVVSNMGFAALLLSDFIPLNYIGGLMVFAMLSTSVGTLTILASTIQINRRRLFPI